MRASFRSFPLGGRRGFTCLGHSRDDGLTPRYLCHSGWAVQQRRILPRGTALLQCPWTPALCLSCMKRKRGR